MLTVQYMVFSPSPSVESRRLTASSKIILPYNHELIASEEERGDSPLFVELIGTVGLSVHCSVEEFTAPEGTVYVPSLLAERGGLFPGTRCRAVRTHPPKCETMVLRADEAIFTAGVDMRALLEGAFREDYKSLSIGDTVVATGSTFEVADLQPESVVSLHNCDPEVAFLSPPPVLPLPVRSRSPGAVGRVLGCCQAAVPSLWADRYRQTGP